MNLKIPSGIMDSSTSIEILSKLKADLSGILFKQDRSELCNALAKVLKETKPSKESIMEAFSRLTLMPE